MIPGEDKVNEPIARGGIPSRITGRASIYYPFTCTLCGHRIAHGKWKETKQQPGTAGPGNVLGRCLVSFHFLWAILCPQAVDEPGNPLNSAMITRIDEM